MLYNIPFYESILVSHLVEILLLNLLISRMRKLSPSWSTQS